MIESLRRNLSQADKEMDECAANLEAVRLANSLIMLLES